MFNKPLFREQEEKPQFLEFPNYCVNASTIVDLSYQGVISKCDSEKRYMISSGEQIKATSRILGKLMVI